MTIATPALVALSFLAAGTGAIGGLGGAVLLVPTLVLLGLDPVAAAPLGLLSVAASSLAAAAPQLDDATVHLRLGVTIEVGATAGAIAGAALAGVVTAGTLQVVLALAAATAAVGAWRERTPRATADADDPAAAPVPGEAIGGLAGVHADATGVLRRYEPRRVGLGITGAGVAGLVAGLTGTSGGYLKTPITNQVMGVPVKVAAATTVFTVGVTAAAALGVYALRGGIDTVAGGAVVVGGLVGGRVGARLQGSLRSVTVARLLAGVLLLVAVALVIRL